MKTDDDVRLQVAKLRWPSFREEGVAVLVELGGAALPALVDNLANSDQDVRAGCVTALGRIGPAARPRLIDALHHPEPLVRSGAAEALIVIGGEAAHGATAELFSLLRAEQPHARLAALQALVRSAPPSDLLTSRLVEMLSDEAPSLRAAALKAVGALTISPREAIAPLLRLVANDPRPVSADALDVLKRVGEPVVPIAVEILGSEDVALRRGAAQSLATLGNAFEPAIPALVAHVEDDDGDVRKWCVRALAAIPTPPDAVVPALTDRVRRDTSRDVVSEAIRLLKSLGAAASHAAPTLVERLAREDDRSVREAIAHAIAAFGWNAIEVLVDALADTRNLVAARRLGEALADVADVGGWPVVGVLADYLRSSRAGNLSRALESLAPRTAKQFLSIAPRIDVHEHQLEAAANDVLREIVDDLPWGRSFFGGRGHTVGNGRLRVVVPPAQPVTFTVYSPKEARPDVWYTLLAYAHLANLSGEIDADARGSLDRAAPGRRGRSFARHSVAKHAAIVVVPELPGWDVNPPSVRLRWEEDLHRVNFRIRAPSADRGIAVERATNGRVAFYVESILVGEVPVSVFVSADAEASVPGLGLKQERARTYDSVFVSYSRRDSAVVDSISSALAAIGMRLLRDQHTLRSGEEWDRRVFELIDEASIFQLYWSAAAKQSSNVEQEWRYALSRDRPEAFIRPIYWEEPMPPPPTELAKLHFAYYPLATGASPRT